MPASVRPAVAGDTPALHRIAALTFPLACTPDTPDEEKASFIAEHLTEVAFAGYLQDPARVLLVAVDESTGDLTGYSMLDSGGSSDPDVRAALTHQPAVELSKMYVHPDHHGDGTAGRLMIATLTTARQAQAAGIWLGVSVENVRANSFYAKHGFETVGRKRFHIGNRWEDDFVRERAL